MDKMFHTTLIRQENVSTLLFLIAVDLIHLFTPSRSSIWVCVYIYVTITDYLRSVFFTIVVKVKQSRGLQYRYTNFRYTDFSNLI